MVLMQGDVILTLIAVLIALWWWAYNAHDPFTLRFILLRSYWFLILPLFWLILARASDYYSLRVAAHLVSSLTRLAWITLEMLVIYLATFFFSPPNSLPRLFILYYAFVSLLLIGLWRACRLILTGWSGFRRRALLIGTGQPAQIILRAIKEEASRDYEVIGAIASIQDLPSLAAQPAVLGTGAELPQLVQNHGIAELIVTYVNEIPGDIFQGLMECYGKGIEIVPMPKLYEEITGRIPIELVGEHLWALVLPLGERFFLFKQLYFLLKRIIDIVVSLIGLLLFVPFLPALALAIKLDSPGPIFYFQERVGHGGKTFNIIKFRSMIDGAEALTGARWATAYDERVTRWGRVMRKTRLDEVPQLVNVLLGQMSLVGPRPERPEFVHILERDIPFYRARLVVKPGLTGWAQVRYRYGNSMQDALRKLQYDLYYIRHQSLFLDLIIAVKTISTMIRFQGT
jgi:exopolysaccharide biosynthesis polyprenyl glycosylphosphotransferase